jgi:hypothetical protein
MSSNGTFQMSLPMPWRVTQTLLVQDNNHWRARNELTDLDNHRRRDQQQVRNEDGPVVPPYTTLLDLPTTDETDRNSDCSDDEQSVANPSGQRPIVSYGSLAGLLLPCL